jgi:thioredoxin-like negative regulator of GroEL
VLLAALTLFDLALFDLTLFDLTIVPSSSAPCWSAAETRGDELPKGLAEIEREAAAGPIAWAKGFEDAKKESARTGRALLVDFKAEWCGPCKKLDRETYGDEAVIKLVREHFVAVKVDIDKEPALAMRHGVSSIPTTLVLAPGGAELRRLVGFLPPEAFIAEVGKAARSSAAFEELRAAAAAASQDSAAQRAFARALLAAGSAAEAEATLRQALEQRAEDPGLLLELSEVLRASGKLAEAAGVYERILALKTGAEAEQREARLPLARAYLGLRREKEAVAVLDAFLASAPAASAPAAAVAEAPDETAADAGTGAGAEREDGAAGAGDQGGRLEALFLRGYAHARLKDAGKALADLEAARDAAPKSPWALRAAYIIDLFASD